MHLGRRDFLGGVLALGAAALTAQAGTERRSESRVRLEHRTHRADHAEFAVPRGRINQLNLAVNRIFRGFGNARIQPRFERHNALNSSAILAINLRYGPARQQVRRVVAGGSEPTEPPEP